MSTREISTETQARKAAELRALHATDDILVLPCAWDVASAMVFEREGFRAIGTTSLGVAAALGFADGQRLDFQEYLRLIRKIAGRVQVPVSVDIEGGYANTLEGITANMEEVLRAGAVGINIEDEDHARSDGRTLKPISFLEQGIRAIRAMSDSQGVPLFINAKVDAFWLSVGDGPDAIFQETVRRANAYGAAGADCVFIPGDLDREMITRLVAAVPYPLNVVIKATTPPADVLRALGVKRLSMGSGPMRAAMGLTRRIGREILTNGTYETCLEGAIPFDEMRSMFDI